MSQRLHGMYILEKTQTRVAPPVPDRKPSEPIFHVLLQGSVQTSKHSGRLIERLLRLLY